MIRISSRPKPSQLGTSGPDNNRPIFPLASGAGLTDPSGQTLQAIPFFATSAAGTHDYEGTVTNGNIETITIPANADTICACFGCFLDGDAPGLNSVGNFARLLCGSLVRTIRVPSGPTVGVGDCRCELLKECVELGRSRKIDGLVDIV
jgi:hypothetical protein